MFHESKKAEDTIVNVNGVKIGNGSPTFIFGPCAVESYEQVLEELKRFKQKGQKLLRGGGAYKPRTSQGLFGVEGLKILKEKRS